MIDRSPQYFMSLALKEAEKCLDKNEVPVGAVIVHEGKVIARAHNLRESTFSPLAHAECLALNKAAKKLHTWKLVGCEVYVTLEPCVMCAGALQQARVKQVYFGVPDAKAGSVSLGFNLHQHAKLNHRFTMTCLDVRSCGTILTEFFRKKRRQS